MSGSFFIDGPGSDDVDEAVSLARAWASQYTNPPSLVDNDDYSSKQWAVWSQQYALQAQDRLAYLSVREFGAKGDGVTDDSAAIQEGIDSFAAGGCLVFPPGQYLVGTPVVMKPGVHLKGAGVEAAVLIQAGEACIDQATNSYLVGVSVSGMTLKYAHAAPAQNHVGLRVRSAEGCLFSQLRFEDYNTATGVGINDGQTAIALRPTNTVAQQSNCVMNSFRDIFIQDARIGVSYLGLTATGGFDQDNIYDTVATPANVIVGNSWSAITMRNITYKGISAEEWADSEKWDVAYIKVIEDNAICVDLGTSPTYFTRIGRFRINDFNIRCDAPNESTCSGIRIGPGGLKHIVLGVVTDSVWDSGGGNNYLDVAAAQTYYIQTDSNGEGGNVAIGTFEKGSATSARGSVTFAADSTEKTITIDPTTHARLARAPRAGEILVVPRTGWGATTQWWVAEASNTEFILRLNTAPGVSLTFGWSINLGSVD